MTHCKNPNTENALRRAEAIFRKQGGTMRTTDALKAGIHPRTLYAMRDGGALEQLSRGLYRLTAAVPLSNPDLVTVALRVPEGVTCLISALAYHGLTTQIPHAVYVAMPRGAEAPRLDYPPTRVFWFTGEAFSQGIETPRIDRVAVRIYSREKTLADCFKYRNKIGLDTAIEAMRLYRRQRRVDVATLMHYAEICRVASVIRPYLEATL